MLYSSGTLGALLALASAQNGLREYAHRSSEVGLIEFSRDRSVQVLALDVRVLWHACVIHGSKLAAHR